MDMNKYYSQLVGCKIIDFRFDYEDESGDGAFPVFTLQLGEQKVEMALSMDEEGNGGGFAFIGGVEE